MHSDELWSNNDYRYYLEHHGVLGQKWGQRNGPPYPLGSDISTGKRLKESAGAAIKKGKAAIAKAVETHKQKVAEKKAAKEDKKIKKAVASSEVEQIEKIKDKLSTRDFEDAVKRAELNKRLQNADTRKSKIERFTNVLNTATKVTGAGISAWNNFAKITNTFLDTDLPVIGDTGRKNKKEESDKNKRSEKEEKRIKDIIKRADPEELIKNRESLTTSEYEEAMKRFNLDKKAKEAIAHFDEDSFNNYLAHHGIRGQKWGERNGPPYPLDSSVSTGKRLKETSGNVKRKNKKRLEDEFKGINIDDPDSWTVEQNNALANLQRKVEDKSGSWYFGEAKSEGFAKAIKDYDDAVESIKNKYRVDDINEDYVKSIQDYIRNKIPEYYTYSDDAKEYRLKAEYNSSGTKEGAVKAKEYLDKQEKYFEEALNSPEVKQKWTAYKEAFKQQGDEWARSRGKYEDAICSTVLKDLGYEDTPEARKIIYDVIFWD